MSDVFISYSRKDSEFVRILHEALKKSNRETWVDWEGIAKGTEWWKEIEEGIEGADTFVFVISPDSVASEVCQDEINHAVRYNKQVLPLLYKDPDQNFYKSENPAHKAVRSHNFLFFRNVQQNTDDFEKSFKELIDALNLDIDHVKGHTRFLVRALEWDNKGRKDGFLLKDENLIEAEAWLKLGVNKDPKPTDLQKTYIENSRKVEDANNQATKILKDAAQKANQRIRVSLAVLGITLIGATAAGVFATNAFKQAQASEQKAKQFATQLKSSQAQAQKAEENRKKVLEDKAKIERQITAIRKQSTILEKNKKQAEAQRKAAEAQVQVAKSQLMAANKQGKLAKQNAEQARQAQIVAVRARDEAEIAVKVAEQKEQKLQEQQRILARQNKEIQNNLANSEIQAEAVEAKALWIENPQALDNLLVALKTGSQLQNRLKQNAVVPSIVQWQTKIALQQSQQTIQEKNRFAPGYLASLGYGGNGVSKISVSPDGETLAMGTQDGSIILSKSRGNIFRLTDSELSTTGTRPIVSMRFSPNGTKLLTEYSSPKNEKLIKLWDITGQKAKEIKLLPKHEREIILDASFDFPGETLVITRNNEDREKTILKLWNAEKEILIQTFPLEENYDFDRDSMIILSPDAKILAIGLPDGMKTPLTLWDVKTGQQLKPISSIEKWNYPINFSPDGQFFVANNRNQELKIWDIVTRREIPSFPLFKDFNGQLIFSPNGKILATLDINRQLRLVKISTGQEIKTNLDQTSNISTISFSSDSKILTVGYEDGRIEVLNNIEKDNNFKTFFSDTSSISSMTFLQNNTILVAGNSRGNVSLWNLENNNVSKFIKANNTVSNAGYDLKEESSKNSPDGKTVAEFDNTENMLKLFTIEANKQRRPIATIKEEDIRYMTFSPDGRILVTRNESKVKLWDVKTGKAFKPFSGVLIENSSGISFTPDSKILAISSSTNIELWDIQTGKQLTTLWLSDFLPKNEFINTINFSQDGNTLTAAFGGEKILSFNFNLDKLMQQGCTWIGAYLGSHPEETELQQICQPYLTGKSNPKP